MKRLALALGAALAIAAASPAVAQYAGWETFVDPQFGTRISYPADLFPHAERLADGSLSFTGAGARLQLSARRLDGIETAADLRRLIRGSPGYETVTYSPSGSRWLVVSGYRGGDIYYEKFFLDGGTVQGFSIQYPEAERSLYDPVVERMEDSFRAGRSY